jgi:hypothetical protein
MGCVIDGAPKAAQGVSANWDEPWKDQTSNGRHEIATLKRQISKSRGYPRNTERSLLWPHFFEKNENTLTPFPVGWLRPTCKRINDVLSQFVVAKDKYFS